MPIGDPLREHLLTSEKLSGREKALLRAVTEAHTAGIRKGEVLARTA